MNYRIPHLPDRSSKPRENGLTMMMDKGLSLQEARNFIDSSADYTDIVKFGFGTALISKQVEEKISVYREADIRPYFGGTLFELFIVRGMFDDYRRLLDKYTLDLAEVSDGSMLIPQEEKLEYISSLSQQVTVLSEVGSKVADVIIPPEEWVGMMKAELDAGSWKVIAEARESGTIGIYNKDGSPNTELVDLIVGSVSNDDVIWEAPIKSQQVLFIKMLGCDANLGNIAPAEVISLETLRLGLRGDTFFDFLPDEYMNRKL